MIITKKILIWIIIILVAINISTIGTIIYNSCFEKNPRQNIRKEFIQEKGSCKHLTDELNFNDEQKKEHQFYRQNYLTSAKELTNEMQNKRIEMMSELEKDASDTIYLYVISREIGNLHAELKRLTINYYINLKSICNAEQKVHLSQIFNKMTNNCDIKKCKSNRNKY